MPIIAKEENQSEPLPTGMQHAVCAMVCDIGFQPGEYQGQKNLRHQVVIVWELEEKKKLGQFAGQPFQVSKFYTLSLDKKSNLRADIQSWRGVQFNEAELKGFDLERLIGANCFLNLVEGDNGKVKPQAITPIQKSMGKIAPTIKTEPEWVAKFRAKAIDPSTLEPSTHPTQGQEDELPF
jgi:hypothetical protein